MQLPSGQNVNFRRPSYGELREARKILNGQDREAFYSHFYGLLTGLSTDEVDALDAADGLALERAVDAALLPRKEDEERPFGPSSSTTS